MWLCLPKYIILNPVTIIVIICWVLEITKIMSKSRPIETKKSNMRNN